MSFEFYNLCVRVVIYNKLLIITIKLYKVPWIPTSKVS